LGRGKPLALDVAAQLAHIVVAILAGKVVITAPALMGEMAATEERLLQAVRWLWRLGVKPLPLPADDALEAWVVAVLVARMDHCVSPFSVWRM
jgi:hypothetical protein